MIVSRRSEPVDTSPHVIDPPGGWVMNTNNWPYRAAGEFSAEPERYAEEFDTSTGRGAQSASKAC